MTTKKNLQQLKAIVCEILKTDEQTRNSDSLLYLRVLERVSKDADGGAVPFSMTVAYFLTHMKDHGFPPFESVRRARQKLQAEYPDLKACEKVAEMRKENEKEYKAFARQSGRDGLHKKVRCVETGEVFSDARAAAKSLSPEAIGIQSIRSCCSGHQNSYMGFHFEYVDGANEGSTLCWHCANACGGCSWTGRDEHGALQFKPVEGWTAVPTEVSVSAGKSQPSYRVIECPEFLPDRREKSGASG